METLSNSGIVELILAFSLLATSCSGGNQPMESAHDGQDFEQSTILSDGGRAVTCGELAAAISKELNGFTVSLERNGYRFQLRYIPALVMACQEAGGAEVLDSLRDEEGETAAMDQYVLRIEQTGLVAPTNLSLDSLLVGGIEKRVEGTFDGLELPCAFAHVEAGPANAPATHILLGFDYPQGIADRVISIDDGTGSPMEFRFPRKLFQRYAQLIDPDRS